MKNYCEDLALIGVYPPPYGGVGVSLQRLVPYLQDSELDFVIYNTGHSKPNIPHVKNVGWSPVWVLKMLICSRHKVIQLSTSRWLARLFGAFVHIFTGAKIIIYARGYSLPRIYEQGGALKKFLIRMTLRNVNTILVSNPELGERIHKLGFNKENIIVVYPFIPPPINGTLMELPHVVREFARNKSHIIAANGGYIYIDGKDVYGLTVMVDLIRRLVHIFPDIGLIIYIREGADKDVDKFENLIKEINKLELKKNVLIYLSDHEFYPVFRICDIFLRPTSTDGDSNSIREALYFGVPVVASDVVPRPEGTNIYRTGDLDDFKRAVIQVLENIEVEKKTIKSIHGYNAVDRLISIYRKLAE